MLKDEVFQSNERSQGQAKERPRQRPRRSGLRSFLRSFRKDEKGITAVEFALIAPTFFLLLIGILEMSVMLHTQTVIDGAVIDASRQIRTGQAQLSGDTVGTFTTKLCSSLVGVFDCNQMSLDVRKFDNFSDVTLAIQLDANGDPLPPVFTPGGAGDITAVRIMYTRKFFTPLLGTFFGDTGNGTLQMSTAVFRNEPYE